MIQSTLYLIIFFIGIMFSQMNHPLAMGLTLLIQTIMICMAIGLSTKSFWFSYILFLIFLGGMLVLFIYVTSIASNEIFNLSIKSLLIFPLILLSFFFMMYFTDFKLMNLFNNYSDMNNMNNMFYLFPENSIILYKLYNFPTNLITILLMNYLLITLIAIVKITKLFFGPLRSM